MPSRLSTLAIGAASHLVSQIVESALDTGVAPAGILQGHAHDQLGDDPHRPWATRFAAVAEVELPGDQLSVPAQQRIGRDDRAKLEQNLAWDAKRLARQQRPLLIREAKRASLEALAQHAVLGFQVLDNNELLTADPAGEQEDDEGEWRRLQIHPQSLAWRARLCPGRFRSLVDSVNGHHAIDMANRKLVAVTSGRTKSVQP